MDGMADKARAAAEERLSQQQLALQQLRVQVLERARAALARLEAKGFPEVQLIVVKKGFMWRKEVKIPYWQGPIYYYYDSKDRRQMHKRWVYARLFSDGTVDVFDSKTPSYIEPLSSRTESQLQRIIQWLDGLAK